MIKDTHVKDSLYPRVEKALKQKKNVDILVNHISKYMDRNNHILFDLNFSERLVVSNSDQEVINTITGISVKEAQKVISESKDIAKVAWVSNPFTVLMALAIRYFSIAKKKKETELCVVFMSCLYYTLKHSTSFRYGPPKREIMDYTLNKNPNVTNSFKIKQYGTVFGLIRYTSTSSHKFYIDQLMGECTDKILNNYLSAIRTRIGSNIKNLAHYFYQDHAANHFLNKDTESHEEGNYHIADSTMLSISKLSSKVSTNIVSYGFDRSIINKAAAMDINVAENKLTHILENVVEHHRSDLDKVTSSVIELYVLEGRNNVKEISSLKFLAHSMNLYKTNSTKPKVIEIKKYLDKWITDGSQRHGNKFVRSATMNAYRKCVFIALVYIINRDSK